MRLLPAILAVCLGAICLATTGLLSAQEATLDAKHVVIINKPGRFAGWPANHGIWNWGDEIVVGFDLGYHKDQEGHTIDSDRPWVVLQARSRDGGETWAVETPAYSETERNDPATQQLETPLDFEHPDFAARFRNNLFYYSTDRCQTWDGPFEVPTFGRPELLARTDYLIEGPQQMTAFVAAAKEGGGEGQPLAMRTTDGGVTWKRVGWIGLQPPAGYGYAIMPATVALPGNGYFSMIRRGGVFDGEKRWWLEAYVSPDAGASWYLLDEPTIDNAGNPAAMVRMSDGRLAMTYGWRHSPTGIRARLSDNHGQTWSDEIILRSDGRNWDLGYPRSVQRADGKIVTVYYYNDKSQIERYIAATIWEAPEE